MLAVSKLFVMFLSTAERSHFVV